MIEHPFNPLPTNDTHVVSRTLHKPTGIYMGDLILGVVLQYPWFLLVLVISYGW